MELWELCAREHIRDALARYNWPGDALRIDELAQTFCDSSCAALSLCGAATGTHLTRQWRGGVESALMATTVESAPP